MLNLPPAVSTPIVISGRIMSRVVLDITAYLAGPTEEELSYLIDLYSDICPQSGMSKYKISELPQWSYVEHPELTASGRAAAIAGIDRPYLEPVRKRIRDGRAFQLQFWDGKSIADPEGSWSFSCGRIHLRSSGLHAYVKILVPLTTDYEILQKIALELASHVDLHSGHGGLAFVYELGVKEDALDVVYAQARRYWGIDIEDLDATLPLMRDGIKAVSWITLIGTSFITNPNIESIMEELKALSEVKVNRCPRAYFINIGSKPVIGDQHRTNHDLDSYFAVAKAFEPFFVKNHPDFAGDRFIENGNTLGWVLRFIHPSGWR